MYGCTKKSENMAVSATEQDKMRAELDKWDPAWHARKFAELYSHFQSNLKTLYPNCHLVESEKNNADGLVGAPQDVVEAFIQRWHRDMSQPSTSGPSMYDLAKKRNDAFFAECGVCQRVNLKDKWAAKNVHPNTRESIWLYYKKLNKYARFVSLAPRQLLSTVTGLVQSGADVTQPRVMEDVLQRLGPEITTNFEQLTNATALIGDIMEEHLGEDTTSQFMSVVEQLSGNNMNLEELTSMLPMLLGDQVDSSQFTGLISSVQQSVQSTITNEENREAATPEALNASVANMMSEISNNPELMRQLQGAFNMPQQRH